MSSLASVLITIKSPLDEFPPTTSGARVGKRQGLPLRGTRASGRAWERLTSTHGTPVELDEDRNKQDHADKNQGSGEYEGRSVQLSRELVRC